jgi:hypothetical protein
MLTASILSCNKEQVVDQENLAGSSEKTPHEILSITKADFNALQKEYESTKKVYDGRVGSIKSFTSAVGILPSDYDSPQDITYEEALDEVMADPFIGSIINPAGEVIVDGDLYRVTLFGTFRTTPSNKPQLDQLMTVIQNEYPLEEIDFEDLDFDLSSYQVPNHNTPLSEDELLLLNNIVYIPTFANDEVSIQNDLVAGDPGLAEPIGWLNNPNFPPVIPYIPPTNGGGSNPPSGNTNNPPNPGVTEGNWEQLFPSVNTNLDHPMFASSNMTTGNMVNPNGSFWTTIFKKQALYNKFNSDYRTSVNFYNRNFGFWKSIGLKVIHQKKGLLFWKKAKASVIAAGWEGIVYSTPMPKLMDRHYSTYIKGSTLYGAPGSYHQNYMFKLPGQIDLWKIPTPQGDYFAPLILSNGLPVPQNVRNGGVNKIIEYLWGLVMKQVKDGETIIKENNKTVYYNALQNIGKRAIIFKEPTSNDFYLFFPPYFQMAYNTDIIDIPLDSYNADISTGLNLVAGTIVNPSSNFKSLTNWVTTEINQKFVMKQAVVYGSSQRNGTWRGVRVIHN